MKKKSVRTRIYERLKELGCWIHKGDIETRVKEWGHLADYGTRECRKLQEEGLIIKKEHNGSVMYKIADGMEKKKVAEYYVPGLNKKIEVYE